MVVKQDVSIYEANRQTMTLLGILAFGQEQIEQGNFSDNDDVCSELGELDRQERKRGRQASR